MLSLEDNRWDLDRSPFACGPEMRLFFEGSTQREALARLRFLRGKRRLGLVVGEPGLGKSLLLKRFRAHCLRQGIAAALVNLSGLSTRDFYWRLGTQFGASARHGDDLTRLFRQASGRIAANHFQGTPTVALLDDVHRASPDVLTQLSRLARLDAASGSLTLILAGRTAQVQRLGDFLRELIDLRIDLEPWAESDTIGYLQLALAHADREYPRFDDDSLNEIHRLSGGVPWRVNRLAEYSLRIGSDAARETIDRQTVRAAHAELTLAPV